MNTLPLRSEMPQTGLPASPPAGNMEIRHLLFDMCADHDLKANGVYLVATQLADEQVASGEKARVLFLRDAGRTMPEVRSGASIEVMELTGAKLRGKRFTLDSALLDQVTRPGDAPLFFHIHAAREPLLLALARRLRELRIPYAITIHGRYSHLIDRSGRPKRSLSMLYIQHLERRVLESARFVQAITPAERTFIRHVAPRARVELIQNAAYSSRLGGAPRAPERASPSTRFPLFGFIGRYEIVHKGLDLLIEGFAQYRKSGGKGALELVGTGPAREELAAMAQRLGVAEHVRIDGPRFGEDKARTLASWDYLVTPSRFDVTPTGPLQGALAGLPLILTAETGLDHALAEHNAGILIEELTPESVAQALRQAERPSAQEWVSMSAGARRMALDNGDWSAIARDLAALYRSK